MTTADSAGAHRNGRTFARSGPLAAPARAATTATPSTWRALREDPDTHEEPFSQTTLLAIPELNEFDQDELNASPVFNERRALPLVGALLVDEGLITRGQLDACLLLQAQDHPDLPIGQILVRCGYITESALNLALGLQAEMKSSLINTIEAHGLPPADLNALVLPNGSAEQLQLALGQLGVAATFAQDWADLEQRLLHERFDLVLADSALFSSASVLPNQSVPLLVLPPLATQPATDGPLPQSARALIGRFVAQLRAQLRQRDAIEQLHQREFELSTVAVMSRSMCAANTPHSALIYLMSTIRDLFGVEAGTLYQFDQATNELIFEIVLGPHQEELYQQRLPIDRGIAGWVVRHGEPLIIPDVRRDQRFEGMFDHQSGFQTRSILCVPLLSQGKIYGVIQLINKLNGEFNDRDLVLLRILASVGTLAAKSGSQLFERNLGR